MIFGHSTILWLNNEVPIICGSSECSLSFLLDEYRLYPDTIQLVTEHESYYHKAVLEFAQRNPVLSSAARLFWRTRYQPEYVPYKQLERFIIRLGVSYTPLERWLPPSLKQVHCSAWKS